MRAYARAHSGDMNSNELTEAQKNELKTYRADRKEWAERQASRKREVDEWAKRLASLD